MLAGGEMSYGHLDRGDGATNEEGGAAFYDALQRDPLQEGATSFGHPEVEGSYDTPTGAEGPRYEPVEEGTGAQPLRRRGAALAHPSTAQLRMLS